MILKHKSADGNVRLFKANQVSDHCFTDVTEINFREKVTVMKKESRVINNKVVAGLVIQRELYDFQVTNNVVAKYNIYQDWDILEDANEITFNDFITIIPIEEEVDSEIAYNVYDEFRGQSFNDYDVLKDKVSRRTISYAKAIRI